MKLVELLKALAPLQECWNLERGVFWYEHEDIKIQLMFGDSIRCNEYNSEIVPVEHPILRAWYDFEVDEIKIVRKNLIQVSFNELFIEGHTEL